MSIDDGSSQTLYGLSASSLGDFLVPAQDVSSWGWISLYIGTSAYVGQLTPQFTFTSDDESSWRGVEMYNMVSLDGGDTSANGTSATNVVVGCPVFAPYFRVKMTSYTSGSAIGVLQLFKAGPAFQLTTTAVRLMPAKNDIGFVNNDGNGSIAIAAGHAADTLVSQYPGMLSRVLVTATGTAQMTIYDSNTGPTGTIVGIVPASATVGTIIECMAPLSLGIVVAGNSNNPGVSIFFAA